MKTKLSIILPSYNHRKYLKERLDSIFNQTCQDFEVILLDDASTDGSDVMLKKYQNHPKVSHCIINNNNSGSPFKQWAKGLTLAKGQYIWIAESDDTCELNFLESNLEAFKKNTNATIVVAKTLKYNQGKTNGEISHHIFKKDHIAKIDQNNINFCPILNVSSSVFKNPRLNSTISEFTKYRLIGDRVFYHEFFYNQLVVKNISTISYFRKEEESVSTLKYKGITYLKKYFNEHLSFINYVYQKGEINNDLYNKYLHKFFARVRDRLKKSEKLSIVYLSLVIKFKLNLK